MLIIHQGLLYGLRQKNTFVVGVNFKVQYFFVIYDTIFTCNICILVPDMVQFNCYFWMDFLTSALHVSFFGSLYTIFSILAFSPSKIFKFSCFLGGGRGIALNLLFTKFTNLNVPVLSIQTTACPAFLKDGLLE